MFGTDGVRGLVNREPMTIETMVALAEATSCELARENPARRLRVVIGKDTRLSGYALESALMAGFISAGIDAWPTGPLPTPAISLLTRSMRADLGVVISASHNPAHDNGVKLFDRDGYKLSVESEQRIEQLIADRVAGRRAALRVAPDLLGRAKRIEDGAARYVEIVKASLPRRSSFAGMKIVLDCAHGAAYRVAALVLRELDVELICVGINPDGHNINEKCGAMHPELIQRLVVEHQADLGVALDGDGDRVVMVDETGNILNGDTLLGLIATYWHQRGMLASPHIVGTVMTNLGLEQYLAGLGLILARTPVGDRHVVAEMTRCGSNLGGEQSGHLIFSDYAPTGDGLLAALQIVAIIQASGHPASMAAHLFSAFPQILSNVRAERATLDIPAIVSAIENGETALQGQGRLLVRASGTEPVIRVMAEGADPGLINAVVTDITAAIRLHSGVER